MTDWIDVNERLRYLDTVRWIPLIALGVLLVIVICGIIRDRL